MEVMFAMISNKLNAFIILSVSIFLSSCETLSDLAGLSKPDIDDNVFSETPDLVLPPDFGKEPVADANQLSQRIERSEYPNTNLQNNYQTINPRITNYISPKINIQSSPSPSDSLERFKKIKSLPLENGFTVNTLMVLKEVTYITDLFMTKVIISLEDIFQEIMFHHLTFNNPVRH